MTLNQDGSISFTPDESSTVKLLIRSANLDSLAAAKLTEAEGDQVLMLGHELNEAEDEEAIAKDWMQRQR